MEIYNSSTNTVNWNDLLEIQEFKDLSNTPQNSIWHKEGTAYMHTCMVTEKMLEYVSHSNDVKFKDYDYRDILVYSALLHDLGKITTTKIGNDNLYHCKEHAIEGIPIANSFIDNYLPNLESYKRIAILSLIRYHMVPFYILEHKNPKSYILKIVNNLKNIDFESLLLLKRCDYEGSIHENEIDYKTILENVKNLFYEICSYPAGTKVVLEKMGDFIPNYPHEIHIGDKISGSLSHPITVGFRTSLGFRFSTSPVTEIIDKNHFKTQNSIYKIIKQE